MMDNENVALIYNSTLFSCQERRNYEICRQMNGSAKYAELTQTQRDKCYIFSFTCGSQHRIFRFLFLTWSTCNIQETIKVGIRRNYKLVEIGKKYLREEETAEQR